MAVKYHNNFMQGSEAWLQARCGILTASTISLILTPTLKVANNAKTKTHIYSLIAERMTNYVVPQYESYDMMRGHEDEIEARRLYSENYEFVETCGFVTNDDFGYKLGYSPDGLVGEDGLIECKSRLPKYQAQTILEHSIKNEIPEDFILQVQAGLLITGRKWCDFISYCGGMPMVTTRVYPDLEVHNAIKKAAKQAEEKISDGIIIYEKMMQSGARLIPTERTNQEIQ